MDKQEVAQRIEELVGELLQHLDVQAAVVVDPLEIEDSEEENPRQYIKVSLEVDEAGEMIGRRGSRLQDFANILNLMLPADAGNYSVIVDVNGYRQERAEQVREIARSYIEHTAITASEVDLDPMPAWERKIVHQEAQGRTDVMTVSEGQGDERRVVIKPVSAI